MKHHVTKRSVKHTANRREREAEQRLSTIEPSPVTDQDFDLHQWAEQQRREQ